jgi:hypothetical protein
MSSKGEVIGDIMITLSKKRQQKGAASRPSLKSFGTLAD